MSSGTQISDMTVTASPLPAGAFTPIVVTDPATGLNLTISYRYDLGTDLATRINYATMAASGGAALTGFLAAFSGAVATTVQTKLRHLQVNLEDEGVSGANTGNQATAIQSLIDQMSAAGGGTILGVPGAIYRCTTAPVIKDNVTLNLNSAKILLVLSGVNDQGVRLRNNAHLCNGTIEVQSSGSSISAQASAHAPVSIGPLYGSGGTVASPSADEGVYGWSVRNMTLSSNKWVSNGVGMEMIGSSGIAISGGCHHGVIEGNHFPDSSTLLIGISADWGFLGSLSSVATLVVQNANKAAYLAGTAYQTYPHNITIRNNEIGALSAPYQGQDTGSFGIRLSGVYNFNVTGNSAVSCTNMGFLHTVGDLGAEFAPVAIRPLIAQDITVDGFTLPVAGVGGLFQIDTYADNIATAIGLGYANMVDPLVPGSITLNNMVGTGPNDGTGTYGGRVQNGAGVIINSMKATGYLQGLNIDALVRNVVVNDPVCSFNWGHGIFIDHAGNDPEYIEVNRPICEQNGQGVVSQAGLWVGHSKNVTVNSGACGKRGAADPKQLFGLVVADGALGTIIDGPVIRSTKAGGTGFVCLSSTAYNQVYLVRDVRYEASVAAQYAGLDTIPFERAQGANSNGRTISRYKMASTVTPTGLLMVAGDRIEYEIPAAGGVEGLICTVTGTFGSSATMKNFGSIAA